MKNIPNFPRGGEDVFFERLDDWIYPRIDIYLHLHRIWGNVWAFFEIFIFGWFLGSQSLILRPRGEGQILTWKSPEIDQKSKFQKKPKHSPRYNINEGKYPFWGQSDQPSKNISPPWKKYTIFCRKSPHFGTFWLICLGKRDKFSKILKFWVQKLKEYR